MQQIVQTVHKTGTLLGAPVSVCLSCHITAVIVCRNPTLQTQHCHHSVTQTPSACLSPSLRPPSLPVFLPALLHSRLTLSSKTHRPPDFAVFSRTASRPRCPTLPFLRRQKDRFPPPPDTVHHVCFRCDCYVNPRDGGRFTPPGRHPRVARSTASIPHDRRGNLGTVTRQ